MTRETILTLAAALSIGFFAWLEHADPSARVAMTIHQAEEY